MKSNFEIDGLPAYKYSKTFKGDQYLHAYVATTGQIDYEYEDAITSTTYLFLSECFIPSIEICDSDGNFLEFNDCDFVRISVKGNRDIVALSDALIFCGKKLKKEARRGWWHRFVEWFRWNVLYF